jgi:hypothetical protein
LCSGQWWQGLGKPIHLFLVSCYRFHSSILLP